MIELGAFYSQIEAGIKEKGFTLDEVLCEAKKHSIDWVDVNADYFYKIPPKEFAQNLKKHGIGISSVHGLTVCDVSSDEKIDESIRCMKEQMEFAKMAGSKFFMIVPQPAQSYREDMKGELEESFRRLFSEIAKYGKEIGIQATVENFSLTGLPYTSFDDIRWLMENVPDLMYTYDSGNYTLAGFDEVHGAKMFYDKTVYAHFKDVEVVSEKTPFLYDGLYYDGPALDDGIVKNNEVLEFFKEKGYDGIITIEICSANNEFEKLMISADRYIEKI